MKMYLGLTTTTVYGWPWNLIVGFLLIGFGFLLGLYVLHRSRLKKVQAPLQSEIVKAATIIQSIGDGIISVDKDGIVNFVNPQALKLLNASEIILMGKKLATALVLEKANGEPVPEVARPSALAFSTGKVASSDAYFYVRPDRTRFAAAITASPIIEKDQVVGVVQSFRDVTETKEVQKSKDEFVALASHQLRTPLSAIGWFAEMLLNGDAGKLTAEQDEYVHEISDGNKRMIDMVNALLDVSRLDLGKFIVEPQPTDITILSGKVIKELAGEITRKQIEVSQNYDPTVPRNIPLDPRLIWIIIHNFMTNAIKYTPNNGKVALNIRMVTQADLPIAYWSDAGEKSILITVADTGYGIPDAQKHLIFSKLFRADNVLSLDVSGNGLGLYIVKAIIEQSGGKVWFTSKEKEGTTFFVNFPLSGMKPKAGTKRLGT